MTNRSFPPSKQLVSEEIVAPKAKMVRRTTVPKIHCAVHKNFLT
jgi:hypothetical protein